MLTDLEARFEQKAMQSEDSCQRTCKFHEKTRQQQHTIFLLEQMVESAKQFSRGQSREAIEANIKLGTLQVSQSSMSRELMHLRRQNSTLIDSYALTKTQLERERQRAVELSGDLAEARWAFEEFQREVESRELVMRLTEKALRELPRKSMVSTPSEQVHCSFVFVPKRSLVMAGIPRRTLIVGITVSWPNMYSFH